MNYFHIFLVHPCDTASNGGCNQICNKHMQKYTCACEGGFTLGKDEKTCIKGWMRLFGMSAFIFNTIINRGTVL